MSQAQRRVRGGRTAARLPGDLGILSSTWSGSPPTPIADMSRNLQNSLE